MREEHLVFNRGIGVTSFLWAMVVVTGVLLLLLLLLEV